MPSASNFRRLPDGDRPGLTITFDGMPVEAREGDSVAAALIAAGRPVTRSTPVSGAPRGPYCMMGVCFECLVEIDGTQNLQGCMVQVREGMAVRSMHGARSVGGAAGEGADE